MPDDVPVTDDIVADFQKNGVVVLRQAFGEWVEPLRAGVDALMAAPSPLERTVRPTDGSAPFFQDLCNWQRIAPFREFVMQSPAARIAARLMQSKTARFFSWSSSPAAARSRHGTRTSPTIASKVGRARASGFRSTR